MAANINKQLYSRTLTAVDNCKSCLERINQLKVLNAFISVFTESVLKQAYESDQRYLHGTPKSVLDGLPIAVKDNFCTYGEKTTCASRMLENFIPPYDATVVYRLKAAGAIIIGKTNLDEFAMGSGTVDSIYGATKNVWGFDVNTNLVNDIESNSDKWRIAGGSSGGSAIAVTTGMCFGALGSDTGGSTRNPASHCGVVGFKPSYGVVSRHGLIPLVNSMDVPGIIAQKVDHVAQIFDIICGPDNNDSTMIHEQLPIQKEFDIKHVRIGIPDEYKCDEMSDDVINVWRDIYEMLADSGASVERVSMPHIEASVATYSVLNQCEVASNMARYSGLLFGHRSSTTYSTNQLISESRKEGFGPVVRSRILAGNYFLLQRNYEKYFTKAAKVRRLISNDFSKLWSSGIDFILTPTTLTPAPLISQFSNLNRHECLMQDYCTLPANMAGCPAISVPVAFTCGTNLPIGLQIIANNFQDRSLFPFAKWIESKVRFPYFIDKFCDL